MPSRKRSNLGRKPRFNEAKQTRRIEILATASASNCFTAADTSSEECASEGDNDFAPALLFKCPGHINIDSEDGTQ